MKSEGRLAVLIDGDNAPRTALKEIMEECVKYGTPTVKRIYGDWTMTNMDSWKPLLLENALIPVQQYSYTTGKNSTDSAMIIDAMDILYSQRVDGFVLVTSDSDFTRLALRLREAGMKVYGVGEKKTPAPFIAACDRTSRRRGRKSPRSPARPSGKPFLKRWCGLSPPPSRMYLTKTDGPLWGNWAIPFPGSSLTLILGTMGLRS